MVHMVFLFHIKSIRICHFMAYYIVNQNVVPSSSECKSPKDIFSESSVKFLSDRIVGRENKFLQTSYRN